MVENQLHKAIKRYADSLTALEEGIKKADFCPVSSEQILDVLLTRHTVQIVIDQLTQPLSRKLLTTLNKLDNRLRKLFQTINYSTHLSKWRTHLKPPQEAWWWFLDSLVVPWTDRYDSLWSFLALVCVAASVSIGVDISSHFLSSGPDFIGVLAVIIQSVLTLLAGGGVLTQTGQQAIEHFLQNLKLPKHWWHEVSFLFSLLLFLILLSFHQLGLPLIADKYNFFGEQFHSTGQLASAEDNFNRALKLNPDNSAAHYNLGQVYESLLDERASTEYQLAVKGGYYKAYYRLARLYILKGKKDEEYYSKAIALLTEGSSKAQQQAPEDKESQYLIRTYMGWARLGQKRYDEAEILLKDALALQQSNVKITSGLAHCLMANVLEEHPHKQGSNQRWEQCVAKSNQKNPDEDRWLGLARQYLEKRKEK